MTTTPAVYVVSAARTPIGSFLGALSSLSAPQLGSAAIRAALERARLEPSAVDEVFFGNVLGAGVGQAPARQASLGAAIPDTVPCTTVSKVCGSGLQSVVLGARALLLGDADVVVTGGMESMSRVPYYLDRARTGYRMGDGKIVDGMIFDGLWDPYNDFHMGNAGELCAKEYALSREAQDAFAAQSYERARAAIASGAFEREITPVEVPQRKGDPSIVAQDEEPGRGDPAQFGKLRPAFAKDGTITAANASTINDGAAAVVLASEAAVKRFDLTPRARLVGYGSAAQAPEWFTTAPAKAIERTLARLSLQTRDIDLWEINEAFSCVTMACTQLAGIEPEKVNVRGGAVALGHPIGASGARILTTLLHALEDEKKKRGLATLCIGGGEAVAAVIERL
ncbi:MAG: acetyl-CoA C-acyltransferase [Myxococcales bacterium]|jgi:acetyl-CoA C-acetyltransferase|nr:acetyl-CoA C-acyltransferase [Myxococcales bacterium]